MSNLHAQILSFIVNRQGHTLEGNIFTLEDFPHTLVDELKEVVGADVSEIIDNDDFSDAYITENWGLTDQALSLLSKADRRTYKTRRQNYR